MKSEGAKKLYLTRAVKRMSAAEDRKPAAQSQELESSRKAVDDAASASGALWLSYLFALFYFSVAAGAVTNVDLLLERSVKLPFLGIDLPLQAFFALAPILFVIVHVYTLSQFALLGAKAAHYQLALYRAFPSGEDNPKLSQEEAQANADARNDRRRLLPNNIFVQFLVGPPEVRGSRFGRLLEFIAWTTLVFGPILLLLLLQIKFLPYHSQPIIWIARIAVAVDLLFIWWLWRRILSGARNPRRSRDRKHRSTCSILLSAFALTVTGITILFSWIIAAFPGDWAEDPQLTLIVGHDSTPPYAKEEFYKAFTCCNHKTFIEAFWNRLPRNVWEVPAATRKGLFEGQFDPSTRRRASLFSNTLVLPGFNLLEALNVESPEKVAWKEHSVDLRFRHLEGAVFVGATLGKADFAGAFLTGALLDSAQLQGASLEGANLERASLESAKLQGATFNRANLQGAWLFSAELQVAFLEEARLEGAYLIAAKLHGASLDRADLQWAILDNAQLQGASLKGAKLQGASFVQTEIQGASLDYAKLEGAFLRWTQLQGAALAYASLYAADLRDALVWRAHGKPSEIRSLAARKPLDWNPNYYKFPESRYVGSGRTERWTPDTYADLRRTIAELPDGHLRADALTRIKILDCPVNACDTSANAGDANVRSEFEQNIAPDYKSYNQSLAKVLGDLVCAGIRPLNHAALARFTDTGDQAPALIDRILSPACPVSKILSDDDRDELMKIKSDAMVDSAAK